MADTPSRLFTLVAILIAVWVLVYWLYEPRPPKVTADTIPPVPRHVATPTPSAAKLPPPPVLVAPPAGTLEPKPEQKPAQPTLPPAVQPPAAQPAIIEPQFRQYVVQAGDVSWEAIAQRVYGDRKMASIISRANPLATSDRLKPGKTVLNIPIDPTNIQGKPAPANPEAPKSDPPASTPPKTVDTTYVVQEGDTLWAIAKKVYGKGALWEEIFEANRDKIKDKDRPVEGTVLRIPPRRAE